MKTLENFDKKLSDLIINTVEKGNEFDEKNNFEIALSYYEKAWEMLPFPKTDWDLAKWIADCKCGVFRNLSDWESAKQWAMISLETKPSNIDTSPLIQLGMVYFDSGNLDEACSWFDKAYKIGKYRAFQGEDKKYWDFFNHGHTSDSE